MSKLLAIASAVAVALASASSADAASLVFTFTGADTFSFTLAAPSTPFTQTGNAYTGPVFYYSSVPGKNGLASVIYPYATFYSAANGGGVSVGSKIGDDPAVSGTVTYDIFSAKNLQLYSGSQTDPVFTVGTYALSTMYNTASNETLKISTLAPAAVPETTTWAMFIGGFGIVGAVVRRRRTSIAFA